MMIKAVIFDFGQTLVDSGDGFRRAEKEAQGQKRDGTHRISQFPELEKYFKAVIVAGEGGIPPKPDPKPFQLCLAELDIDPSEAVYVGDDLRIDICGAQDAGIRPCHAILSKPLRDRFETF